jgi:hypothetical protein
VENDQRSGVGSVHDTFSLPVVRFVDKDGLPTCAANFWEQQVCTFYRTTDYGTNERCAACVGIHLYRRGESGSLIPDVNCPLWDKDER